MNGFLDECDEKGRKEKEGDLAEYQKRAGCRERKVEAGDGGVRNNLNEKGQHSLPLSVTRKE